MGETKPNPIIMLGGLHQMLPGYRMHQPRVQSRRLHRCLAGKGFVYVNGRKFELTPGTFIWAPWNHSIRYEADKENPYLIAGVQLIPHYVSAREPLAFQVAHSHEEAFADSPCRQDAVLEGLEGIHFGRFEKNGGLSALHDYILKWLQYRNKRENEARQLARLLLYELRRTVRQKEAAATFPTTLQNLMEYCQQHMHCPLSLTDLCAVCNRSPSTVIRLFKKNTGKTPLQWILQKKMEHAATLLKTSTLNIGEIGQKVGIDDPYYFSKRFKQESGSSPGNYRLHSLRF